MYQILWKWGLYNYWSNWHEFKCPLEKHYRWTDITSGGNGCFPVFCSERRSESTLACLCNCRSFITFYQCMLFTQALADVTFLQLQSQKVICSECLCLFFYVSVYLLLFIICLFPFFISIIFYHSFWLIASSMHVCLHVIWAWALPESVSCHFSVIFGFLVFSESFLHLSLWY